MLRLAPLLAIALTLVATRVDAQLETSRQLGRPPTRAESAAPATTLPPPTPAPETQALPAALPTPSAAAAAAEPEVGANSDIDARMDAIDDHLTSLAARRSSNVGSGVVSLLLGGTYIGLGVYANRNGAPIEISRYFYLAGVGSIVTAGLGFGLQPNTERAYTRFSMIRDDRSLGRSERLRLSEGIFRSLARRRTAQRFSQGAINLGVTAASIPFLLGGSGFDRGDAFDWVITISAAIGAINAISTMVQRTEEERRWRMYQVFAGHHGGDAVYTSDLERPRLRFAGAAAQPVPGGGIGAVGFIF